MAYGPAGNSSNKFTTGNPISRRLMRGFIDSVAELYAKTDAASVLEVGCGEGQIQRIIGANGKATRSAFDIDFPIVLEARTRFPDSQYFVANAERIPVASKSYDVAMAIEVLEHLPDPNLVLTEMKRVARNYCIFSVPREPIWRALNMARGMYLPQFGNTPGHVGHWSSAGFVRMVEKHFEILEIRKPLPWTMVLARVEKAK